MRRSPKATFAGGAVGNARRGAERARPSEQPLPLGLFLRKHEYGKGNVGAPPLLETLPTGAQSTSPRRAERRGEGVQREKEVPVALPPGISPRV